MSSSEEHILAPLEDAEKQIRLLQPVGGRRTQKDTLSFRLMTCRRSEAPPYRAISYTWGEPGGDQLVLIDGKQRHVRKNCHYSLWQAQWHFPAGYIWIDSVCIDQDNLEEKSNQVSNMGDIYKQATLVLACLGPHADDSDWLASLIAADEAGLIEKCENSASDYGALEPDKRLWDAHKQLACREYWTRVWVVPEMVNAAEVQVLVGDAKLLWSTLEAIERAYRPYHPYLKPAGCFGSMCMTRSQGSHSIQDAVGYFSATSCADPRDRIYAHCSIIDWRAFYGDKLPLHPDYTLSSFQLAQKLVEYFSEDDLDKALVALDLQLSDQFIQDLLLRRRDRQCGNRLETPSATQRLSWAVGQCRVVVRLKNTTSNHLTAPFRGKFYENDMWTQVEQILSDDTLSEPFAGRPPQPLYSGPDVAGFACNEARAGDLLCTCSCQDDTTCLVLRYNHSDFYDIVGQAILNEGISLWSATEFGDSPQIHPQGKSLEAHVTLDLTAEDVIIYHLQGLTERSHRPTDSDEDEDCKFQRPRDIYQLEQRMARLITNVTATPCCAAKLTDMIDPVEDPDWETEAHI